MKENKQYRMDDLLVKYLLDEANNDEQQEVRQWIAESGENRRYFDQFRAIWDAGAKIAATGMGAVPEDEAWERFRQRTERVNDSGTNGRTIPLGRQNTSWLRAAAMLLLLAGAGWVTWLIAGDPAPLYVQAGDDVLVRSLPDGTTVTLNKHAGLRYPKRFKGGNRSVELEGEAFFDVAPDKSMPFIIAVNDVSVRVVGTSFNIKSTTGETEIIVETGRVEVSKEEEGIVLNPREKLVVTKNRPIPAKQAIIDDLYNYYRTKEFVCNNTPLRRLADVLNEAYNVDIHVSEPLKNLPLTTTFRNEPLDHILTVIGETFNIRVERNGRKIILK